MCMKSEKRWFSRKEAAVFLTKIGFSISPRTLQKLAVHNNALKGPPFLKTGWRTVRYDRSDLEEWANKRIIKFK